MKNKASVMSLYTDNPWSKNSTIEWLASTLCFYRNLEKFKFPHKLEPERAKQLVDSVSKEIMKIDLLSDPLLIKAEELSALDKEFLVEHFLANQSFHQASIGEAFIFDKSKSLLISLNIHNHIQFECLDTHGELESAWSHLVKIESAVGKRLSYSFSSKFGFLTADPTQCGTALIATVFLQLSGLIHTNKIDQVLEKLADESLLVTGIQGSPTEIIGDVLAIQNNYTLGLTEENIITSLRAFTTKILVEEQACRNHMRQEQTPDIKDKVSRAYGILIHSYQIEAIEALNALSLIKLGMDLKWVTGLSFEKMNEIFFNCRRAHLFTQFKEKIPQEEVSHRRAEFIHQALDQVKLTF